VREPQLSHQVVDRLSSVAVGEATATVASRAGMRPKKDFMLMDGLGR
jgi:hypothetical protein